MFPLGAACLGAVLMVAAAGAQNLDAGKSAPRLFADSCAECHRSTRGLAKGRLQLTLYLFLKDHYASNSSAAWALTSYLESADIAKGGSKGGRTRTAAAKSSRHSPSTRTPPRPPRPVPQH
jgi:hypothetical protein